jgi:NAD(P)-dependent dehydrogenase (short-subunit alcohol dehydrogenase family)
MLLENKIALITGAASGIGAACARLFVEEGARVVLTDCNRDSLHQLSARLGESAHCLHGDISQEAFVSSLLAFVVDTHGRLDCAVNSAGISSQPATIDAMELADWQRMLTINLTSVFLCLKHELKQMRQQRSGAIVNIASGAALIAVPLMADYCAAKHGVLGLTRTAASEVVKQGIRVNALLPGSIHTPMLQQTLDRGEQVEQMIRDSIPCGRFGRAEEIAENCAWLCCDRASYVSGAAMLVDYATVCR